jgi:hypothetical protein
MRRLLLALVLLASGPFGAGAHATAAVVCALEGTFTFDPPLTTTTATGTIQVTYTYSCPTVDSSGEYHFRGGTNSGLFATYTGDCKLAILSGDSLVGVLVGGADFTRVGSPAGMLVPVTGSWALVPDQVCNERTAHGPDVWTAVWPY